MLRTPGVPLLPGTEFRDIGKTNYPKLQHFSKINGILIFEETRRPKACPNINHETTALYPPYVHRTSLAPWIVYDKQMLCFYGYFKEQIQNISLTPYVVRKVKIYFYLEDDTIKIVEPKIPNSGIAQGCIVSRQRIPKCPNDNNQYISILDLNINNMVNIFNRIYHITGCDDFTRKFLNRAGISVPDSIDSPSDPDTEMRRCSQIGRPKHTTKINTFGQFLKYDRKILKFNGYWNDDSEFGDIRNLEIFYYLADDTIEIKEIYPVNSGRDGPKTFLKRGKLPKIWNGLPEPGEENKIPVLNTVGGGIRTGRYITDSLKLGLHKDPYFVDQDLIIGAYLNVYGREVVLTDCDKATQEYYRKKYGIEDFTPLSHPNQNLNNISKSNRYHDLPPFNGWGTHEDSEGYCLTVVPKPPQADFKKFAQLGGFVLRFCAQMISNIKENNERQFVISYYLEDDTVSIFELVRRNSGFLGGEFIKRTRILLPNQDLLTSKRPAFYKPHHFYIGAKLTLRNYVFHLLSADEYTLMYMEHNPFLFPNADIDLIMTKIREALRPIYKNFIGKYLNNVQQHCGENSESILIITSDILRCALLELLENSITEHEILTVCRYFDIEQNKITKNCNRERVRAYAHLEIRRSLWDDFERLKEHIYQINICQREFLEVSKIRSTILACRLPFKKELIDTILEVLKHDENGLIECNDFIDFMDVKNHPAPAIEPMNIAFELCSKIDFSHSGKLINWTRLIDRIGLEEKLKQETE